MAIYRREVNQQQDAKSPRIPSMELGDVTVRSLKVTLEGSEREGNGSEKKGKDQTMDSFLKEQRREHQNDKKDREKDNAIKRLLYKDFSVSLEKGLDKGLQGLTEFTRNPLQGIDKGLQSVMRGTLAAADKVLGIKPLASLLKKDKGKDAGKKPKVTHIGSSADKSKGRLMGGSTGMQGGLPFSSPLKKDTTVSEDKNGTYISDMLSANLTVEKNIEDIRTILLDWKPQAMETIQRQDTERAEKEKREKEEKSKEEGEKKAEVHRVKKRDGDAQEARVKSNLMLKIMNQSLGSIILKIGLLAAAGATLWPLIWSKLTDIAIRIQDFFSEAGPRLKGMIAGLAEVIKESIDRLVTSAKNMIGDLGAELLDALPMGGEGNLDRRYQERYGVTKAEYDDYMKYQKYDKAYRAYDETYRKGLAAGMSDEDARRAGEAKIAKAGLGSLTNVIIGKDELRQKLASSEVFSRIHDTEDKRTSLSEIYSKAAADATAEAIYEKRMDLRMDQIAKYAGKGLSPEVEAKLDQALRIGEFRGLNNLEKSNVKAKVAWGTAAHTAAQLGHDLFVDTDRKLPSKTTVQFGPGGKSYTANTVQQVNIYGTGTEGLARR